MGPTDKDTMLRVRMSEDERKMLDVVAERRGVTASEWIRRTIQEAYGSSRELNREERGVLELLSEKQLGKDQIRQGLVRLRFFPTPRFLGLELMLDVLRKDGFIEEDDKGRFALTVRGRAAESDGRKEGK